tara:strand:+ start:205 stop:567 length:363 start_codon:yes stop_codon:yes gene_type:complete
MTSEESESIYDNNFFWSFYELSNGKILDLQFIENLTNGRVASNTYYFGYANNFVQKYQFGNSKPNTKEMSKEFFDWLDSSPLCGDFRIRRPDKDEEKCVKEFYLKYIEPNKDIETSSVEV